MSNGVKNQEAGEPAPTPTPSPKQTDSPPLGFWKTVAHVLRNPGWIGAMLASVFVAIPIVASIIDTQTQTSLQETQAQGERQLRLLSIALEQTQDPRYREGVLRLLGSVTPESDPLHTWASEEVSRYEDDRSRQAELDELAAQMEDKDAEL